MDTQVTQTSDSPHVKNQPEHHDQISFHTPSGLF